MYLMNKSSNIYNTQATTQANTVILPAHVHNGTLAYSIKYKSMKIGPLKNEWYRVVLPGSSIKLMCLNCSFSTVLIK